MDLDADWYCDHCGAYMNDQEGFTAETGVWVCTACGCRNSVTYSNLFDFFDMLKRGIEEFTIRPTEFDIEVDD